MSKIKPWKILRSEQEQSYRVFALRRDRAESPLSGKEHDFFILESPPWVNVIPLTEDNDVVLIYQHRHGIRDVTLEIPGGLVENGMTPFEAAKAELIEETGCTSDDWTDLGWVHPNPAILDNRCHSYVARNVVQTSSQRLDEMEDIDVLTRPLRDIPGLIQQGAITHALMIAAFYRLFVEFGDMTPFGAFGEGA